MKFNVSNANLVDDDGPGVLNLAILNVQNGLVDALGERSSLFLRVAGVKRDLKIFTFVVDALDGRNNAGGTSTKHLNDTVFLNGIAKLRHGHLLLNYLDASLGFPLLGELNNGVTGDTGKNGSIQRRSDEFLFSLLILHKDKQVHGANFGQLMFVYAMPY
jgi:hypothetical protein